MLELFHTYCRRDDQYNAPAGGIIKPVKPKTTRRLTFSPPSTERKAPRNKPARQAPKTTKAFAPSS
jgi:hypothetical protein